MEALTVLIVFTLIGIGVCYAFRALMTLWLYAAMSLGVLTIIILAAD